MKYFLTFILWSSFTLFGFSQNFVEIKISEKPNQDSQLYVLEENLSLGNEEPTPKIYQPTSSMSVDQNGNIYIIDENRIKKFDPTGDFICYIGNRGQGPGETYYPSIERIINDTLVVGQGESWSGTRKYELFHLDGTYIKRLYWPVVSHVLQPKEIKSINRFIETNKLLFISSAKEHKGIHVYSSIKLGLVKTNGDFIKELLYEAEPWITEIQIGSSGAGYPFTLQQCKIQIQNNKIYVLSTTGSEVYIYSVQGTLLKKLIFQKKGKKITNEDKTRYIKNFPTDPEFEEMVRKGGFPNRKPLFSDMIVSEMDQIWLKKGDNFGNYRFSTQGYSIVTANGEYLADQITPIEIKAVQQYQIYGFLVTDDDLVIFKRFQLRENTN